MAHDSDNLAADDSIKIIRKYRKKLRQIERLEASGREFTEDEQLKLKAKSYMRSKLQEILLNQSKEEELETEIQNENSEEDINDKLHEEEIESEFNETQYQPARENLELTNFAQNIEIVSEESEDKLPTDVTEIPLSVDHNTPEKPTISTQQSSSKYDNINDIKSKVETNVEPQRKVKEKRHKHRSKLRKLWRNKTFKVFHLEGHNEDICDIDVDNDWLVSGSRDTSVKLWKISTLSEISNMAGHNGSVTGVKLINEQETDGLRNMIKEEVSELMHDISTKEFSREQLLLTVSYDCYIKLWILPQGVCIKSIYNYSPISSLFYYKNFVFAGSDTGKLTGYNLISGKCVYEELIHNDAISSLKGNADEILSTSLDGNIKLFEVYDKNRRSNLDKISGSINLNLVYSYKDTDNFIEERQILTSCINKDSGIWYFGDDGVNLKALDKSAGIITRYPNHKTGSPGFTDGIITYNNYLFLTSYDLDSGDGSINIRIINGESPMSYIASLSHRDIPRLTCMGVDCFARNHTFVTGGNKLLVWVDVQSDSFKNSTSLDVEGHILIKGKLSNDIGKHASPSDVESDSGEDTEEGGWQFWKKTPVTPNNRERRESESCSDESDSSVESQHGGYDGWSSWCSLL